MSYSKNNTFLDELIFSVSLSNIKLEVSNQMINQDLWVIYKIPILEEKLPIDVHSIIGKFLGYHIISLYI